MLNEYECYKFAESVYSVLRYEIFVYSVLILFLIYFIIILIKGLKK